jgi:hypothetical protein
MSLNDLDATEFNPIDELDPSLSQGYRVIYDREVIVFLRGEPMLTNFILGPNGDPSPLHW